MDWPEQNDFPPLSPEKVHSQLNRILNSSLLARGVYLRRLLRYCVEHTLDGNTDELKELLIGQEVFDRKVEFDPLRDPIVRVQARRLRTKLSSFYRTEGLGDQVHIAMPVGSYIPVFTATDNREWPTAVPDVLRSIAVLPLKPLDDGPQCKQFAETLTANLTHCLVENGGLQVVSRASAAAFPFMPRDARATGRSLGAQFLVEGFVMSGGAHHRVGLQVTSSDTGYHCWAAWFYHRKTRTLADVRNISRILRDQVTSPRRGLCQAGPLEHVCEAALHYSKEHSSRQECAAAK